MDLEKEKKLKSQRQKEMRGGRAQKGKSAKEQELRLAPANFH